MRTLWFGLLLLAGGLCLAMRASAETDRLSHDEMPTFDEIGVHKLGTLHVDSHSFLVLPGRDKIQALELLSLDSSAAIMIPTHINELRIARLEMRDNARIVVVPGNNRLRIDIGGGYMEKGSIITAQGTSATDVKPAGDGRDLSLRLQHVEMENLLIDVRGGSFRKDDTTKPISECPLDLGDVLTEAGGSGGEVYLELPEGFPSERIQVLLDGGKGRPGPCNVVLGNSDHQGKGLEGRLSIVHF